MQYNIDSHFWRSRAVEMSISVQFIDYFTQALIDYSFATKA